MTRPPFPSVIDNSLISEFRSCPQKCFRTYFEHWKPQQHNVHLHAGKAFAHGLEVARRTFYEGAQSAEASVAVGLAGLLQSYGDYEPPADSAKSPLRMAQALEYYFEAWPLDTDTAKPRLMPSGKRAIEFSFAEPLDINHPVTGEPIIYTGRADMVVEMANGIFIEDDKTTSALGASWANQWDLRSQFTGYTWAAKRIKLPADGILVRGVAILKTMFKHEQYLSYRAAWEIDRWYEQLLRDVKRMIQCWESGYWDYNLADACGDFGGCLYRQPCKSPNPQEWLNIYFARRRWDPVSRTEIALDTE